MARLQVAALVMAALSASVGEAGWISGGTGELRGDSGNPWFLDIPEQPGALTYCVDADEEAMGLPRHLLLNAVAEALKFWQVQLPSAHFPEEQDLPKVRVKVGPFQLRDAPCDDTVDLAFQLGKISTPEQQKYVAEQRIDLTHFVGFAARLSYDKFLRGRGFVYIAPQTGPLRPTGQHLLPRFWSSDGNLAYRLTAVLTHEVGHVLGIAHFGDSDQLMGQDFPEKVVTDAHSPSWILWKIKNVFRAGDQTLYERCFIDQIPSDLLMVFGLAESERCVRMKLNGDGLLIFARTGEEDQWHPVAQMVISDETWKERYYEVVRLWLPEEREVFKSVPGRIKALKGPSVVETMVAGFITSIRQAGVRPALLTIDPLHFQLGVVVNGRMNPDVLDGHLSGWQRPLSSKSLKRSDI